MSRISYIHARQILDSRVTPPSRLMSLLKMVFLAELLFPQALPQVYTKP